MKVGYRTFEHCSFVHGLQGDFMNDSADINGNELDQYGVWVKTPPLGSEKGNQQKDSESSDVLEDDGKGLPEVSSENAAEQKEAEIEESVVENEIPFEDEEKTEEIDVPVFEENSENENREDSFLTDDIDEDADLSDFDSPDASSPEAEAPLDADSESEVSLDEFMDNPDAASSDVDVSEFMDDADSESSDVDVSEFMDSGSSDEFGDGDIDLDAFMDGESFSAEKEEQAEIEENEPLDIDLEFDNSVSPEVNEESVDDDAESVFENAVDETASEEVSLDDFDPVLKSGTGADGSEEISLDDFGFSDDSDNVNPTIGNEGEVKKEEGPVDYEMTVDIDDENSRREDEGVESSSENASEEDFDVDITQDSSEAEQVEQKTDLSSPDDDFDVDSILNNVENEGDDAEPCENVQNEVQDDAGSEDVSLDSFMDDEKSEDTTSSVNEEEIDMPSSESSFNDEEIGSDIQDDVESFEKNEEIESDDIPDTLPDDIRSEDVVEEENSSFEVEEEEVEDKDTFLDDENEIPDTLPEERESIPEESKDDSDEDISLDSFMGEEGFTDGGPGVTGPYNEDGTLIDRSGSNAEDACEGEETSDTESVSEDFAETPDFESDDGISDEESDGSASDESGSDADKEDGEPSIADVSAFLDKAPEYDMTGVSVTLDDLDDVPSEPVFKEEAVEEDSLEDDDDVDIPSGEKQVYSVFVKTESEESADTAFENAVADEGENAAEPEISDSDVACLQESADNASDESSEDVEETMASSDDVIDNSEILKKIADELENLKSEINGLKTEFETLKNGDVNPCRDAERSDVPVSSENDVASDSSCEEEDTGFFSDSDDDDTIALSGNELSNILNSAEFSTQDGENLESGVTGEEDGNEAPEVSCEREAEEDESCDFSSEPDEDTGFFSDSDDDDTIALSTNELSNILNSAEFSTEESESLNYDDHIEEPVFDEESSEDVEEETEVPTVDDIIVESSASGDLIENSISTPDDSSVVTDGDIPDVTLESLELGDDSENEEPLTESNIEYLSEGANLSEEEEEELETGISEHPVEQVFNKWDSSDDEAGKEKEAEAPVSEKSKDDGSIPSDMKEEIKSVLSYMDQLLENLPEDKIEEFAKSEQFETYKKLFSELGLS